MAGPPAGGERGKLAQAARLLAEREGAAAALVNPHASPETIAAGLASGGWRQADPSLLPTTLMEEWVQAAAEDVNCAEVAERVSAGVDPPAAVAWWALSGLISRHADDGDDQPLWRAWATALLVHPDLRRALPDDVPRKVLDRLRMSARERLRALWWHASSSGRWDRLATLEQLGRSGDRRRRWSALDEASEWAPSWAWEVSRGLADSNRPGRNQEVARIAAWEANHLIENGGELALIGTWLRAAGQPPPEPAKVDEVPLRLGQAARLLLMLGPGDVPVRSEYLRLAGRAAAAAGGWAELRGALDAIDFTAPDARRALRAAIGAMQPKALQSRRAWNSLRARFPRLPAPETIGIGEPRARRVATAETSAEEGPATPSRTRRRRRLRSAGAEGAPAANGEATAAAPPEGAAEAAAAPAATPARRRRRRRRRAASAQAGEAAPASDAGTPEN